MNNEQDHIEASHAKLFWKSLTPFLLMIMMMGLLFYLNATKLIAYTTWGIFPREWSGLKGILLAPWVHGSIEHLGNNAFPLLVLGTTLLYYYQKLGLKVLVIMYFLTGLLVWLSARESYHIGASGLIYALAGFLFLSGILRREKSLIAVSLLVTFLYGSLFWGIFPVRENVSWESHFWGGIVGFVLAWYYRKEGPQRKRYDWELEEDENPEDEKHLNSITEINQTRSNPLNKPSENRSNTLAPKQRLIIKYEYKKNKQSEQNANDGKPFSKKN